MLYFYFHSDGPPQHLHSFPTRRSSDLLGLVEPDEHGWILRHFSEHREPIAGRISAKSRSEEHTSELQSRFDLVCRLLLEKKKYHNSSPSRSSFHTFSVTLAYYASHSAI